MEILLKLSLRRDLEFRNILRHKVRSLALACLGYLEIARESALRNDRDRDEIRGRILAEKHTCLFSHRSGETEDSFLADVVVATNAGQQTAPYSAMILALISFVQKGQSIVIS